MGNNKSPRDHCFIDLHLLSILLRSEQKNISGRNIHEEQVLNLIEHSSVSVFCCEFVSELAGVSVALLGLWIEMLVLASATILLLLATELFKQLSIAVFNKTI